MKIQRTTIILVLLALGLGGFVYYFEFNRPKREEVVRQKQLFELFDFEEKQVQSVQVQIKDRTLLFERQAETGSYKWMMRSPESAPASEAAVVFLLSKLVNAKSDRAFTISAAQLSEYGLDEPIATVEITLDNGKTHQLRLGNKDFINSQLYGLVDAKINRDNSGAEEENSDELIAEEELKVVLVPADFEYAVDRPLSEWKPEENDEASSEEEESSEVRN
ncbi:MAG: DUF4340 domain-containing protein [Hormoscilla sp. SP5CHS1]|nr:DUF4340 domain-containing protein [Hormoscilla sp. SP5CHS1]